MLFQQDNIRVLTWLVTMAKHNKLGYKLPPHPRYFLDLPPNDYFLFPKKVNTTDEKNAYFENLDKNQYLGGIKNIHNFGRIL